MKVVLTGRIGGYETARINGREAFWHHRCGCTSARWANNGERLGEEWEALSNECERAEFAQAKAKAIEDGIQTLEASPAPAPAPSPDALLEHLEAHCDD